MRNGEILLVLTLVALCVVLIWRNAKPMGGNEDADAAPVAPVPEKPARAPRSRFLSSPVAPLFERA